MISFAIHEDFCNHGNNMLLTTSNNFSLSEFSLWILATYSLKIFPPLVFSNSESSFVCEDESGLLGRRRMQWVLSTCGLPYPESYHLFSGTQGGPWHGACLRLGVCSEALKNHE